MTASGDILAAADLGNGVFRSSDNGDTWTSSGSSGASVLSLAVNSVEHLLAGYRGGLARSADNGVTWTFTS